jgi:Zn-finger nucleic acid-binding protein
VSSILYCPRCAGALAPHEHAGVLLHDCHRCGGCFAARGAEGTAEALWCPACAAPMRRMSLSAVHVDYCERHGVWIEQPRAPRDGRALVAELLGGLLEAWLTRAG